MKKKTPYTIKIEAPFHPEGFEELMLWRYSNVIKEGYSFSHKDFDLYCALLVRKHGIEKLNHVIKNHILENEKIKPEIQFHITALALENDENVEKNELETHLIERRKRAFQKKEIVKNEIHRTGINPKKITLNNSQDYRNLIQMIRGFDDLTLIDWFIPITLSFEKFVHIYIKHFEETKFGNGEFKKRTFFDYDYTELLSLIKLILYKTESEIKDHFAEVQVGNLLGKTEKVKDFHRGFKHFPPIIVDGDKFSLTIDKFGRIMKFHQLK